MHQESSSDIKQLQQQLRAQKIWIEEHQTRDMELQSIMKEKDGQIQAYQHKISSWERVVKTIEKELWQEKEQLQPSEQLVSEFQQSLL